MNIEIELSYLEKMEVRDTWAGESFSYMKKRMNQIVKAINNLKKFVLIPGGSLKIKQYWMPKIWQYERRFLELESKFKNL